ncbi:uncharacterized protein BX663DRAFT_432841 [Cokeromyces recurvatus]|uniref:uncharacterized protein n=1 Tax=Cokeromyces recurvatus TaxID=90255 RepID=UPI00221ED9BF|nr:uncharacterized protein BX663DRAFT_432841 [Cokeromyces recurvatus]KAI7903793.1 hypothetical protein BX663DRAFT_432841 [Cokeromyces recurvatus]
MAKNIALKDAQNKLKFLADMSHEIRTPMNAVIALTDLLLQEKNLLTREQTEHLEVIQTSGNHLLTVINDILDISKINHDPKFKLEYRRFNIRKCVKDAVNMARHQASMIQHSKLVYTVECPSDLNDDIPIRQLVKQIEANSVSLFQRQAEKTVLPLIWKIDSDVPDYLMGDSMRLTQILLNLCSNAVKFTKSGGIQVKIARYKPSESNIENDDDDSHAYTYFKQRYDAKLESTHACKESKNKRNNDIDMKNRSSSSVVPSSIKDIVDPSYCYYYDDDHEDMTTEEKEIETEKVMLELSVTDTGIGMPANRLPRLFKSFSQIDISTARRYGGTGLGLAISNMLVDRMGGALWVESKEGLGSRFALTLPLFVSPRRISSSTMTYQGYLTGILNKTSLQQESIPSGSSKILKPYIKSTSVKHNNEENLALHSPIHILLAEDNVLNQKIAISILKRLGYQDVIIASNGREVLELMRIHKFDVIFVNFQV